MGICLINYSIGNSRSAITLTSYQKIYAGASCVACTAVAPLAFSSVATGAVAAPIGWWEIYNSKNQF